MCYYTLRCRAEESTYLDFQVVLRTLHPSLHSSCTHSGGQSEARGTGDSVFQKYRVAATSSGSEKEYGIVGIRWISSAT